jgi:TRAP-type C4-dicarboxylate transport system permease small subunit
MPPAAETPELWTFVVSNVLAIVFAGLLTAFSYLAYRRNGARHFRTAALGFAAIGLGVAVEPVYELGGDRSYLGGRELFALHGAEGLLMAVGFALLFYSVYSYRPRAARRCGSESWNR